MKNILAASLVTLTTLFSAAHAIDACEAQFKGLYKDIIIYNETEKISEGDGMIGDKLQVELKVMKSQNMSIKDKVHALETSFVQCDMELDPLDEAEILMNKEAMLKTKNPLKVD